MLYMKLFFFAFFVSLLFVQCNKGPEKKACDAVSAYIKENLDDPSSYDPGQFEVEPSVTKSPEYQKKKDSLFALMQTNKLTMPIYFKKDSALDAEYRDRMTTGWDITHSFRAKNKMGALVLTEASFYVDKDYKVTPKDGN